MTGNLLHPSCQRAEQQEATAETALDFADPSLVCADCAVQPQPLSPQLAGWHRVLQTDTRCLCACVAAG